MSETDDQEQVKRILLVGESPDYCGVVLVTDPGTAQRNVLVFPPEAALCLAEVLRFPLAVEALAKALETIAHEQVQKASAVREPSEAKIVAMIVDRDKPVRLDS